MPPGMAEIDDLAARCIRCGFCLESCPTFALTGNEAESPRGRIHLAKAAVRGEVSWPAVQPHFDSCLGCRACETACPSGVEYGRIMEGAREEIVAQAPSRRAALLTSIASSPLALRAATALAALLPCRRIPRTRVQAPRVRRSEWPVLAESGLPPVTGRVYLLEGCAMGVLFPGVHEATRRLLRRVGVEPISTPALCCGALAAHSGLAARASRQAKRLADSLTEGIPLVVNSAGCGSHLKDLAHSGDPVLESLASRAVDISEFLLDRGLDQALASSLGLNVTATYHDACHLAHGQGVRSAPRRLLQAVPGLSLTPLPESEFCCGSAGVYNLLQPKMARDLLARKYANIASTGAEVVVMGNPGCHAWIEQACAEAGSLVRCLHTAEVLEGAFSGFAPWASRTLATTEA